MKILILGANGFVGTHLEQALRERQHTIVAASLRDPQSAANAAAGCDIVVNLAGEPIAQKWTPAVKAALRSSRVDAPRAFLAALANTTVRPKHYISASAIGYYGTSKTAVFDETSAPGKDFLAGICVDWEKEAERARDLGMNVSIIRTGLVLGNGGIMDRIAPIFKLGGGGPIGDGSQWYSWVHIDDLTSIYCAAIDGTDGVLNATAPNPVTNKAFTVAFGEAVHRPAVIPVPAFALKLMFGEGAVVALEGQHVLPDRTLATGYKFKYPNIEGALRSLV